MFHLNHKSCFSCKHYLKCKDPKKSFNYVCDRHYQTTLSQKESVFHVSDLVGTEVEVDYTPLATLSEGDSGYDISDVIDKIIAENTLVAPDIKINDRDFPKAKNFYEFTTGEKFLNQKPFVMQLALGVRLFGDYCPSCSDTEWLENDIKARDSLNKFTRKVALLEHGVCPYCGKTRLNFYRKRRLPLYDELAACTGQRSGKSALVGGLLSPYIVHRYLKLQNPNEVLGLLKSTVLHGTFVALTATQAKENLWDFFFGSIMDSPWFQGYNQMLAESGSRHGDDLIKIKDTFINYKHRRLLLYYAPPDGRVLRGRTRIYSSLDEIGFFDNQANSKKIKINANEVYVALSNSLRTVRSAVEGLVNRGYYDLPSAYFMNISSPSSVRDKIMSLVRESVGSTKMLGVHKATWEMNPTITRKSLADEFRKNYSEAMKNYGAQPPLTSNPLFSSEETISNCFTGKRQTIQQRYARRTSKGGEVKRFSTLIQTPKISNGSVMAIDAGYANNSFALTVGTLVDNEIPRINFMLEIQPAVGMPLHYRAIYDSIIAPLVESCNVKLFLADRWNSLKLLADVEQDFGIQSKMYSLKYRDFMLFRDYVQDAQVIFPGLQKGQTVQSILTMDTNQGYPDCFRNDPVAHFCLQLMTVQDTGNGVIKGDQLTDDLFRSCVLGFKFLVDPEYSELWSQVSDAGESLIDVRNMAVLRTASGGSSSISQSQFDGPALGKVKSRA